MVAASKGHPSWNLVKAALAMDILADQVGVKTYEEAGFFESVQRYLDELSDEELSYMERYSHENTPYGEACRRQIFERLMIKK